MLTRNIAIGWIGVVVAVMMFITLRVIVPGLINLHNDGALIAAFLLVGLTVTLPFIVWVKVIKPLINQEP